MNNISLYQENRDQIWSETDPFTEERYRQFFKYLKDNTTILDIGSNTGRGGQIIKAAFKNCKLFGVELVKERIELTPSHIYEHIYNESINDCNFLDLTFDYIIAGEVIEHIPEVDFALMLKKCKEILKEKGVIIFTTPNPNSILVKLGNKAVFNDPSHVNIMSINKFKKIVFESGLRVAEIKGSGKVTRYISPNFPFINLFGSYL
jgi:SAM-dependent methyltransferase